MCIIIITCVFAVLTVTADYDNSLKMPVCSRYGADLFQRYFRPDGHSYNVCQRYYWLFIGVCL